LKVDLEVPAADSASVEEALIGMGASSVTLADPGGEPILEPGPGEAPLWSRVVVSALLPSHTSRRQIREHLRAIFSPARRPQVRISELVARDWLGEWRRSLRPIEVGNRLWICPPGMACSDPGATTVQIEPGLAFGTGAHATTAMCLAWLASMDLAGRSVLDWGCGSGILAIAALALGAASATALDIDPQALEATRANAARNDCANRLQLLEPSALDPAIRFDVVVANILADSLISLAPQFQQHSRAGADLAMSGILTGQADSMRQVCARWINLHLHSERDDWVLLAGTPVN
jgi:ribosomal protein L11 methyltransferase